MRALFTIIFFMLTFSKAFACSCFEEDLSVEKRIESHESVVQVKTQSREIVTTGRGEYYKTKVSVIKFSKGVSTLKEYYLMTETENSSSCGGPPPDLDQELLVYAWKQDGGLLYSGGCSTYSSISHKHTEKEINEINEHLKKGGGT